MIAAPARRPPAASGLCAHCGIPVDALHFDDSSISPIPPPANEVVLARFQLPEQYCGIFESFFQFTDLNGKDPSQVQTPGLQWLLLVNGRPLYPYTALSNIINPWGYCPCQVKIRLDEGATVELVVRRRGPGPAGQDSAEIKFVGGRIAGRYWYNAGYGDVDRGRF